MEKLIRASWAGVVASDRFICIQTYSGYRATQMDYKGAVHYLDPDTDDQEVGAAFLDALRKSRFVASSIRRDIWMHPEVGVDPELYDFASTSHRYEEWVEATRRRYGYKSRRELFKILKCCNAKCQGGVVNIQPMKKDRGEGWIYPSATQDVSVKIDLGSAVEDFGAAVRLALSRCSYSAVRMQAL
jgi:hypothetical protein